MGGTVGFKKGGYVSMRNVTVRTLIEIAYALPDYRLSRGPAWTASAGYDVEAKPEQPVDEEIAMLMLQNMLAERFHVRVHHESTAVSGFNLVVEKGGSRLQLSNAQGIGFRIQSMDEIQGPGNMAMLARTLRGVLRAPVEDHTGLNGKYDIQVKWSREEGAPMASAASVDNGGSMAAEPTVSIFTALKQQLGLSLEASKMSVDLIVIDGVERPTEN